MFGCCRFYGVEMGRIWVRIGIGQGLRASACREYQEQRRSGHVGRNAGANRIAILSALPSTRVK